MGGGGRTRGPAMNCIRKYALFSEEARVPFYGTGIGFVVGLLIVIADETVAPRPVLNYSILKLILIASLVGVGYVGSLVYK